MSRVQQKVELEEQSYLELLFGYNGTVTVNTLSKYIPRLFIYCLLTYKLFCFICLSLKFRLKLVYYKMHDFFPVIDWIVHSSTNNKIRVQKRKKVLFFSLNNSQTFAPTTTGYNHNHIEVNSFLKKHCFSTPMDVTCKYVPYFLK